MVSLSLSLSPSPPSLSLSLYTAIISRVSVAVHCLRPLLLILQRHRLNQKVTLKTAMNINFVTTDLLESYCRLLEQTFHF